MDYEQTYNEALWKAKELRNGFEGYNANVAIIEQIFPELRESEDERIRMELFRMIELLIPDRLCNAYVSTKDRQRYLAWLEKQKEKTPRQRFKEAREKYSVTWKQEEKQKKQKPALEQTLEAYKISDERATAKMDGRIEGRQDVINNPEEYGLQKPAEWSEEDEKMMDSIINELGQHYKTCTSRDCPSASYSFKAYQKEIDWLKSLRPSWKPSEEQMEALKECGWCKRVLRELYEQLKKLM